MKEGNHCCRVDTRVESWGYDFRFWHYHWLRETFEMLDTVNISYICEKMVYSFKYSRIFQENYRPIPGNPLKGFIYKKIMQNLVHCKNSASDKIWTHNLMDSSWWLYHYTTRTYEKLIINKYTNGLCPGGVWSASVTERLRDYTFNVAIVIQVYSTLDTRV